MRGTPLTIKCPKCRKGQFGHPKQIKGVRRTGLVEPRITCSRHTGHKGGGCSFAGYRGQMECLDCGHTWYSTHPDSGRIRAKSMNMKLDERKMLCFCGGRLLPKSIGGMVLYQEQSDGSRLYEVRCERCLSRASLIHRGYFPAPVDL